MDYIINDYEPKELFHYFEELTKIPHGSGNEKEIADYLETFAKNHSLNYRRDSYNNIFIKKTASNGYENRETVMLQGHMDMVCEKNGNTVHDFLKDPLDIYVEKGYLKARGTTLGGDDGVAVAMIMTLLASDNIKHPNLECLITTGEETGMYGAFGFDCSDVEATKLINLDSEEEGTAIVGCAGGARAKLVYSFDRIAAQNKCVRISVEGLSGGHSGGEIHLPRKNSIVLMGRILEKIYNDTPFNLISINGGNKDNAIPRECNAVISSCEADRIANLVKAFENELRSELGKDDKKLKIKISRAKNNTENMLSLKDTSTVLSMINLSPNGVFTYSPYIEGFVESSNNLGIVDTENDKVTLITLCRSSTESLLETLLLKFERLAKLLNAEYSVQDRYSGWQYDPQSKLQNQYLIAARKVYGESITPKISAIHAGLECGVLKKKINHYVDAISIGPNILDIHTPKESLNLKSFADSWKLLLCLLEQ